MPHGAPVTRNFCRPPQHLKGHLIFKNQKLFPSIEFHYSLSPPLGRTWCSQHSSGGFSHLLGSVIPVTPSFRNVFPFTPLWPGSVQPFKGLTKPRLFQSCPVPALSNPGVSSSKICSALDALLFVPCFIQARHSLQGSVNTNSSVSFLQPLKLKEPRLSSITPSSHWSSLPDPTVISLSFHWS